MNIYCGAYNMYKWNVWKQYKAARKELEILYISYM